MTKPTHATNQRQPAAGGSTVTSDVFTRADLTGHGVPGRWGFGAPDDLAALGKDRRRRRRAWDEGGSVTLWLVIMTVAMIAAVGLVFDGGEAQAAKGQAVADAYAAARAGAETLNQASFATGGPPTVDTGGAISAAHSFLYKAGVGPGQADVVVDGGVVTVTVHLRSPAPILSAIGVGGFDVAGTGRARAIYGLEGPRP